MSFSLLHCLVPDGATDKMKRQIRTRHGRDETHLKVLLEEIKRTDHLK
jgi:hypothetical protein